MLRGLDQAKWTGRKAATTAIAASRFDPSTTSLQKLWRSRDGISGADASTGSRAVARTELGVELSLAEMGVTAVTDAHHQPDRWSAMVASPGQTGTGGAYNSCIGRHIHTMHPCTGIKSAEVGDTRQILITGTANELHPMP